MKRTWLKRTNPERRKRELERQFGELAEYVRGRACCVRACRGWAEPAHVHSRRSAGAWIERDGELVGNIAPLCNFHHREQHRVGIASFQARHELDLEAVAALVGREYVALGDTSALPY